MRAGTTQHGSAKPRAFEQGWRLVQEKAEAKALLSFEEHMEQLKVLRDNAAAGDSAAISAEVKRGDLRKFYVKQVEHGGAGEFQRMTDEETRRLSCRASSASTGAK
jgi:hypothetical protein